MRTPLGGLFHYSEALIHGGGGGGESSLFGVTREATKHVVAVTGITGVTFKRR